MYKESIFLLLSLKIEEEKRFEAFIETISS